MALKVGVVGEQVTIVKSSDLSELKLDGLAGRTAVIKEEKVGDEVKRSCRGYWVKLTEGEFQGEVEWFIPRVSVRLKVEKAKRKRVGDKLVVETEYSPEAGVAHISVSEEEDESSEVSQ